MANNGAVKHSPDVVFAAIAGLTKLFSALPLQDSAAAVIDTMSRIDIMVASDRSIPRSAFHSYFGQIYHRAMPDWLVYTTSAKSPFLAFPLFGVFMYKIDEFGVSNPWTSIVDEH